MLSIILAVAAIGLVYYYLTKPFNYWKNQGIHQTNPKIIFGDNYQIFAKKQSFGEFALWVYNFVPDVRFIGMYQSYTPTLVIKDPELIKQIGIKDFDSFTDHITFIPEDSDPLWGKNLFALTGKRWRDMRTTLSPSFTSSKMRGMFGLIIESSETFTNYYLKQNKPLIKIEMKDAFTRYATDVIASTAFGIKVDSLEHKENEFFRMGKDATNFNVWWKNLIIFGYFLFPSVYRYFKLKTSIMGAEVTNFFLKIVRDTIKTREENNIIRPDMIHLLMEARKGNLKEEENESGDTGFSTAEQFDIGKVKGKVPLEDMDIAAQALIFFFGGFDTTSALMCFAAYELAVHPDVQSRLREEIQDTLKRNNGKITYEALLGMNYMDMVISEVLRLWPPAIAVDRVCNKPYTIEAKYPEKNPVHLKVNDVVWFSMMGLHRDANNFPNPEKFDPERFSEENKSNIKPYTYIPFGVGPRNCIGSRFALIETKAVLFHLLCNFEIVPTEKTQIPLVLSKASFNLMSEGGFNLGLKRIAN